MTYTEFAATVKKYRPELTVGKRRTSEGRYPWEKRNTIPVTFPNGKLYEYKGTYTEVLKKLKIEVLTESTKKKAIAEYKTMLKNEYKRLENNDSPFASMPGYKENILKSIEHIKNKIAELES